MKTAMILLALCSAAEAQQFKSSVARKAIADYQRATAKALQVFEAAVANEQKKLARVIGRELKKATTSGDLKEANRYADFLKSLSPADPKAFGTGALVGTWSMKYPREDAARKIVVGGDGTVTETQAGRTLRAKVVTKSGSVFFVFSQGKGTHRVTVIGSRMFIEEWPGKMVGFPKHVGSGFKVR